MKDIESFGMMEAIVNSTGALIYVIDLTTHEILYANERCNEEFGDVIGKTCFRVLQSNQDSPCSFCPIQQTDDPLVHPVGTIFEWENQNSINNRHYLFNDRIIRWKNGKLAKVQIGIDITKQKNLELENLKLTHYDQLTSLSNRLLLRKCLERRIGQSDYQKHFAALLCVDLDYFKSVNDTSGYSIGDMLLVETGKRISNIIHENDIVARTGGDEFVVLIDTNEHDKEKALSFIRKVAKNILVALQQPYLIMEYDFRISASIGIALFNDDKDSIDDLLKYADSAMYNAKSNGRNTFEFFDPKLQQIIEAKAIMIERLRKAIEKYKMGLYYQPQIFSSDTQKIIGVEALIRWYDSEHGMISPANFIPLAEECGLIIPLGEWILREAIQQLKIWESDDIKKEWRISVNVSNKQFEKSEFIPTLKSILHTYNINPSRLRLELTESLLIKNTQEALIKINELKTLGFSLSIDDFGTGYSSLSYLKQLPIDELKIDQSFIRDLTTNRNDVIIVETIISIGQKFGLEVIAEGVETEEQYQKLVLMGCEYFQGYLFGRPILPDHL